MKVLIVAGGTGGHFYPGLAVAKELIQRKHDVSFIVRHNDLAIPLLKKENLSFYSISSAGFKRSFDPRNLLTVFKLIWGCLQSFWILKRHQPDVVLVMGGYVSVPPSLAAKLIGLPLVLHEQNARPGLANQLIARLTTKKALAFSESAPWFTGEIVVTGNPVRPQFLNPPHQAEARRFFNLSTNKKTLLVFGGSQGARGLNTAVIGMIHRYSNSLRDIQFIHLSGSHDHDAVSSAYQSVFLESSVTTYCHQMEKAYAAGDLVLCRSGASTVTELMAVRKPAILIPYPYATGDHQTINARVLEKAGAAVMIEEAKLNSEMLFNRLRQILDSDLKWQEMKQGYAQIGLDVFSASRRIADFLETIRSQKEK